MVLHGKPKILLHFIFVNILPKKADKVSDLKKDFIKFLTRFRPILQRFSEGMEIY